MKIQFYLLGLLIRCGPQHGYRLKQYISEGIADFSRIKLPAIYYHLNRLLEDGYVSGTVDKEGNRPEKIVYAITENGRSYFNTLIGKILAEEFQTEFNLDGVLYFFEPGEKDFILDSLKNKRIEISEKFNSLSRHRTYVLKGLPEGTAFLAGEIFNHHLYHHEAELKWLDEIIEGLSTD